MPASTKSPKNEETSQVEHSQGQAVRGPRECTLCKNLRHEMGKGDFKKAEAIKKDLLKPPKPTTSIKSPMKMGSTAVKMPKNKTLAGPFSKPSLFFKKEEFQDVKKSSIENLRTFLESVRAKK